MVHIPATDSMPDLQGRLIDGGRMLLLDTLGSGAYGRVYRALDKSSPQDGRQFYAVKCLYKPEAGSHQAEFQSREFVNHKVVCEHPNIVTLHRVVFDKHYVYVVLDLCSGGDLFAAITEKGLYHNNVNLVKKTFVQIIDAVEFCHDRGVFHRDIKPENVLCSEDGTHIWLADFGLSTRNQVSRDLGCGSSYYMSPECIGKELALGRYSTRHSDVWSLGVILTNMISGRNPWRYATTKDDCFTAFLHNKDFLRQVLPISRDVNEILKKIFKLNPLSRITLADLRKEIIAVDTFFLVSDKRAINVNPHDISDRPKQKKQNSDGRVISTEVKSGINSMDTMPNLNKHAQGPVDVISTHGAGFPSSVPSSGSGTSGSGVSSEGPITPATNPVDPGVEVPDLSEEDGIGRPVSLADTTQVKAEEKKGGARRTHMIRSAFQRLKGISPGAHT